MSDSNDIDHLVAHLFRDNYSKISAVLTRIFSLKDIDRVMDDVHDTFEKALMVWRHKGLPDNPSAWLMQVAKNKAINRLKSEQKFAKDSNSVRERWVEVEVDYLFQDDIINDSQLRLLLTCCHPDISEKNQTIITLNILCGLSVDEISNGLFMKNEAVKKALNRSKNQLREKSNILRTPLLSSDRKRLEVVLKILYLMFNEGYKRTKSPDFINCAVCYESIRLTRLIVGTKAQIFPESHALLALMLFNVARFPSRLSADGKIITLENQNRVLWDQKLISEAFHHLDQGKRINDLNQYYLEAMIASLHCSATSFEHTDWEKIIYLYQQLEIINTSPFTTLNKIVAKSYLNLGNEVLKELAGLKPSQDLSNSYLLYSAEGDILERRGKKDEAILAFETAYQLVENPIEANYLMERIKSLST